MNFGVQPVYADSLLEECGLQHINTTGAEKTLLKLFSSDSKIIEIFQQLSEKQKEQILCYVQNEWILLNPLKEDPKSEKGKEKRDQEYKDTLKKVIIKYFNDKNQ